MIAPALAFAAVFALATTVGPTADTSISDLPLYEAYSDLLRAGRLPYRDFAFEYPPLAAPVLAAAVTPFAFGLAMLAAGLAAQAGAARLAGDPRAAWLLVPLPLAAGAIVRARFDLVPAALAVWGLALAPVRPRLAHALLGLGAAVKLFPALVAAAAVARHGWRGAWAGAAVVAVVAAAALPLGLADAVELQLERPVQIESTPASVLWAIGESRVVNAPKWDALEGGPDGAVGFLALAATALALVGSLRLARRDAVAGALAALLAVVALGKVLSPQFLLWLAPFAAAAWVGGHRAAAGLVGAAIVLTQLWFPARYGDLVRGDDAAVALVGLRNALLLSALVLLLAGPGRSTPRAAAAGSGSARP